MKTPALIRKSKQLRIPRRVLPFDRVNRVLIIWDATQSRTDIEEIRTFGHEMRNKGKDITFLAYHPVKKLGPDVQPNELYKICCKGDFNLWGVPKAAALKEILSEPFDLLINACLVPNEMIRTMAVFSKAQFRIGPYLENEDSHFYEISIKPNGADPCENYLIETGRYLRKLI